MQHKPQENQKPQENYGLLLGSFGYSPVLALAGVLRQTSSQQQQTQRLENREKLIKEASNRA